MDGRVGRTGIDTQGKGVRLLSFFFGFFISLVRVSLMFIFLG
jgi:hypothetical protein